MSRTPSKRTVFVIWLGWMVIMFGYFVFVPARFRLSRPDRALIWTADETRAGSQRDKVYLNDPMLNGHVSWDSEFYLAIALGGYEDPNIRRVGESLGPVMTGGGFWPFVIPQSSGGVQQGVSLSYAFFPFYPFLIRILSLPLSILGLSPIGTASVAAVIISFSGTLAAALAIFQLGQDELGDTGGLRAAFYLLIFPSSFFLAVIYTEGLFLGLAFSSLLLIRRGQIFWAAILAVLATFTRAVGVALVIPLIMAWTRSGDWMDLDLEWRQIYFKGIPWKSLAWAVVILSPVFAFAIWRFSYFGMAFSRVEEEFFGRGLLSLGRTFAAWRDAFNALFGSNSQAAAYYFVEFGAIILGFTACIAGLRKYPDLAWFGLLVVFLSFTSGPAQGMHRYILAAPPIYLFLSHLGRKPAFDRLWTTASILIMGVMATMFMFDMWAG
ncbi:MAG: hypothetical protein JSV68_00500 [Anaerolineaceae bacterium]|nr:MAG: hypothetical protein JSV68_00500 [Anaerolineaceae bacterium]